MAKPSIELGQIVRITRFAEFLDKGQIAWAVVTDLYADSDLFFGDVCFLHITAKSGRTISRHSLLMDPGEWGLDANDKFSLPHDDDVPDIVWQRLAKWRLTQ